MIVRLLAAVGLEGAFLSVGVACLAVAASFVAPAGPWVVVGIAATLLGVYLSLPTRRA